MIKLNNVFAGYGNTKILQNISFELKNGENLSIIGPNGCGKTTLLRVIAGTLEYKGEVLIDGCDIKNIKRKQLAQKIAMLSQTTQVYFNYTVYETVIMGRFAHRNSGIFSSESESDKKAVIDAIKSVDMLEHKNRQINTLSGGQLQRVFLAKILAQDPNIILLDEPTNHLDLSYQVELINFLKEWAKRENKMIIGVLHDINLSMQLTNKVLLMENGMIKALGNNKDVYTSNMLSKVYNMNVLEYMKNTLNQWEKL